MTLLYHCLSGRLQVPAHETTPETQSVFEKITPAVVTCVIAVKWRGLPLASQRVMVLIAAHSIMASEVDRWRS